ncbi:YbhB/YbcL family Raf kinase inhibitor-like protein [Candidatus Berkiella aquae]|uniref:Putative kinase inhibitor protein n=1 Tax=Candidatus Berkiella aquae TaxID=295108 RepID=A0A0Q9YSU1_9GAMM|nr:YbhB/YbcL family Raf kinase inhibitor-like protein [Candidatus Berkiella aquae]MCS5711262.1 YbhB/YbcL family Raf kinase inhibitor-like protein [Candidatus Berkiella aquae]
MKIYSPVFKHNEPIPTKYTCEGDDISPPLSWEDIPNEAKSLVLIVDDPDAPDPAAPKLTWVHWILYNLDPKSKGLNEHTSIPHGASPGLTNWNKTSYGGPCPPIGRHRYFHKLYALDIVLPDLKNPSKEALLAAMENHVIAKTEMIGTYQKQ